MNANTPARLVPSEVGFIRDHLGLTNTEFASIMGVSTSQASRWTTSEPIGVPAERLLRLLAMMGPHLVKPQVVEDQKTDLWGVERAREALEGLAQVIHQLPSPSVEAKTVKIDLRRASSGWKHDAPSSAN